MAPIPDDDNNLLVPEATSTPKPDEGYWTKNNIALTVVFAILALGFALLLLAFFLRKRLERKKKANRKSDKARLLDHEDKTSMFSRERHSSVTLYVDSEHDAQARRLSSETMPLVPLHITPLEEVHDPMNNTTVSNGSGISGISRLSTNTTSTLMLSPLSPSPEEGDLSMGTSTSGRPRSASTASQKARYYESTPMNVDMPPIPKIIRTPSD